MAKQRKNSLAPIIEEKPVEQNIPKQEISPDTITVNPNIDSYIKTSEKSNVDYSEKDAEIEVLNEKIESLEKQNKEYIEDNKILLSKIEELNKANESVETKKLLIEIDELKKINEKLKKQADSLLLRNSELKCDITRVTQTLKNVQSQVDSKLHTYTKPGYILPGGYRPSNLNGYQDWI